MTKIKILSFFILLISKPAFPQCSDLLRYVVNNRVTIKELNSIYHVKNLVFKQRMSKFGTKEQILDKKFVSKDRLIQKVIEKKVAGERITKALKVARDTMNDPEIIKKWLEDLHHDILIEYLINSREKFNLPKKIPYKIAFKVLMDRSKVGGFEGTYESLMVTVDTLTLNEFADTLKSKRLILDEMFLDKDHGELIHILQFDLISYALRKSNLNSKLASELYQWLGQRHKFYIEEESLYFESIKSGWSGLFDSFQKDWTSPEKLNPVIVKYLNLTEYPF